MQPQPAQSEPEQTEACRVPERDIWVPDAASIEAPSGNSMLTQRRVSAEIPDDLGFIVENRGTTLTAM